MRPSFAPALISLALAGLTSAVWAQTPDAGEAAARSSTAQEQRVERLAVEGQAVRIEEVRVGGQTESIEVRPTNEKLPAYQVRPQRGDAGIQGPNKADKGLTNRTWKILDF